MLLIVGLDGASYDLCNRWMDEGYLPNLAHIRGHGAWMPLQSTIPAVSPVAWSTFMTGTNPGEHGVFGFFVPERPGPYEPPTRFRPISSHDCHGKCFWEQMNEAGLSTGIVGVPVTYPARAVNGHIVAGLLAPKLEAPGTTYPATLAAEITAQVGPYRIVPRGVYVPGGEGGFLDEVHRSLELRGRLASYLLEQHRCDVHLFVLYETDLVQHKMWQFMDEDHPRYNASKNRWRDAIRDVYVHADAIVGELMEELGRGDTLVVMSDHGAGPLYGTLHLNKWLREQGYLAYKSGWRQRLVQAAGKYKFVQLCARTSRQLGISQRVRLGPSQRRALASGFLRANDIDWTATRAYNMGFQGAIYTVGERHAETAQKLAEHLTEIRDPARDCCVVEATYTPAELYGGHLVDYAPSIILSLKEQAYSVSQKVFAPALLTLGADSGTHRRQGILGVLGAGAKAIADKDELHIRAMAQLLLKIAQGWL